MLTECAVCLSTTPICSAMCMNRLLNTSSMTGSARVPTLSAAGRGDERSSRSWPVDVTVARQPISTTVVAWLSTTTAGPSTTAFAPKAARSNSGTSRQPSNQARTRALARGGPACAASSVSAGLGVRPTASTSIDSTVIDAAATSKP